jgi:hypothetical protein
MSDLGLNPRWAEIPLRTILAQHPLGSTKHERLKAAVKSKRIRYRIDPGSALFPPLRGITQYMIDDEHERLWNCVDWHLGRFHHPIGDAPYTIRCCEEDYLTWLQEEEPEAPPPKDEPHDQIGDCRARDAAEH